MIKIRDSVARDNPKVSRQRLSQIRNYRKRLCIICGNPAKTSLHCEKHAKAAAVSSRSVAQNQPQQAEARREHDALPERANAP